MMNRTELLLKRIRQAPVLDVNHLDFAESVTLCIDHIKAKSLYRPFSSYNDLEMDDVTAELRRLLLLFRASDLAQDAEDRLGSSSTQIKIQST